MTAGVNKSSAIEHLKECLNLSIQALPSVDIDEFHLASVDKHCVQSSKVCCKSKLSKLQTSVTLFIWINKNEPDRYNTPDPKPFPAGRLNN